MDLTQQLTGVPEGPVGRPAVRSRAAYVEPLENRTLMSGSGMVGAGGEAVSAPAYFYTLHTPQARAADTYTLLAQSGGDGRGAAGQLNVGRAAGRRVAPLLQPSVAAVETAGSTGVVVIDRVGDGVVTGHYVYGPEDRAALQSAGRLAPAVRAEPTGLGTRTFDRRPHGAAPLPERRRVLVVEDDGPSCRALAKILQSRGCQVTTARSVAEGLARLKDRPDALILDLMLPDGDGMQLLEHVRSAGLPTRVMVTTGSSDPTRLARVRDLHPEQLLSKPVRVNELLAGVMAV